MSGRPVFLVLAAVACLVTACGDSNTGSTAPTIAREVPTTTVPEPVAAGWTPLLEYIPDTDSTWSWVQLEKPQAAIDGLGFEQPSRGSPAQAWSDITVEASSQYPGVPPLGMSVLLIQTDAFTDEENESNDNLFGADLGTIEAAASAGRSNRIGGLGHYLAIAGPFEPAAVEESLVQRHGDELVRDEHDGIPTYSWPEPEGMAPFSPPYTTLAVMPGAVLLAQSSDELSQMIDAPDSGSALGDDERLTELIDTLEREGVFAADVLAIDGEALYQQAQQRIDEQEALVPDGHTPVGPLASEEASELRNQAVLVPYERLAIGWTAPPAGAGSGYVGATFVLAHDDPAAAQRNAEILPRLSQETRSTLTMAPWSDGVGGLEARSEGTLAIATLTAVPVWIDGMISRQDSFFASHVE